MNNADQLRELVKLQEGRSRSVYLDTEDVPTGGYGHAFHVGSTLPDEIWEAIFHHDLKKAADGLLMLRLTGLNHCRKAVIVSMVFQLGLTGVKRFKWFLAALKRHDYEDAVKEMYFSSKHFPLPSRWHAQTPKRVEELAEMMYYGECQIK